MEIKLLNKDQLVICVDASMYSIELVHKCFYWYSGDYDIEIDKISKTTIQIKLFNNNFGNEIVDNSVVSKIRKDLIDFKTREIVNQETKTIRELIIAKAFFYSGEYDHTPPGDWTDPVTDRLDP